MGPWPVVVVENRKRIFTLICTRSVYSYYKSLRYGGWAGNLAKVSRDSINDRTDHSIPWGLTLHPFVEGRSCSSSPVTLQMQPGGKVKRQDWYEGEGQGGIPST
jgi:hypothetical protein